MSAPPYLKLPTRARSVTLRTPRGALAALEAHPAPLSRTGSAVLLVPGFGGSKEDFITLLGPLSAAGHRVVALDLRGQYESPHAAEPAAYDIGAFAADVLAVAAAMDAGPVHLVGHSFGGLVAAEAVRIDPRAVLSLTLMSSGPAALPEGPRAAELRLLLQALPAIDLPAILVVKRQLELEAGNVPGPPEIEEFLDARFVANAPLALQRMAEQLLTTPDRLDDLARLPTPFHVLYGESDDAWPPSVQAQMAGRLRSRHTVISGAGHSPAVDAPGRTALP